MCIAIYYYFQVWASKWNERAYFSTRKVKLDHDYLCMAVLVQEIINADYAFVIHTTNPSTGDSSEIYAEVMQYQLAFQAYVIKLLWSIAPLWPIWVIFVAHLDYICGFEICGQHACLLF